MSLLENRGKKDKNKKHMDKDSPPIFKSNSSNSTGKFELDPKNPVKSQDAIKPVIYIRDPNLVLVVMHEKRKEILKLLLKREMNIQEIKKELGLNPGTIKRHLQTLIEADIIFISNIRYNDYNIKMKYYRAKAEKIKIEFTLPDDI